jgi:hypothetical protein
MAESCSALIEPPIAVDADGVEVILGRGVNPNWDDDIALELAVNNAYT